MNPFIHFFCMLRHAPLLVFGSRIHFTICVAISKCINTDSRFICSCISASVCHLMLYIVRKFLLVLFVRQLLAPLGNGFSKTALAKWESTYNQLNTVCHCLKQWATLAPKNDSNRCTKQETSRHIKRAISYHKAVNIESGKKFCQIRHTSQLYSEASTSCAIQIQ